MPLFIKALLFDFIYFKIIKKGNGIMGKLFLPIMIFEPITVE